MDGLKNLLHVALLLCIVPAFTGNLDGLCLVPTFLTDFFVAELAPNAALAPGLASPPLAPQTANADCTLFPSCNTCVNYKHKCGWCASEGKCMEGNKMGPSGVNCTLWDHGFCSG